ncbi:hypothetical protein [Spongiactinospora sp. TRM90649]|uniref:hypothetical protein n=1 Tax=Spongiactinospora sp. TRM90649 TaxID=3031114 RepID=UPI0023F711A3|nr:hypothetical protein [Spongiactinospora sp. TRM90649]MDF5757317.1 hypothetical protein [Spongiactinospora sp. TRM90649]
MSVVLSLGAVFALVHGLKEIARDGVAVTAVLALAVGAGAGFLFVRRQLRLPHPLLNLGLFARRRFTGAMTAVIAVLVLATLRTVPPVGHATAENDVDAHRGP